MHLCKDGTEKLKKIHRLMAIAFIPNPENKPHINHKDGNGFNNSLDNLEWVTHKENIQHAFRELNIVRDYSNYKWNDRKGDKNNFSKIKSVDVPVIFEKYQNGMTLKEIAKIYDVHLTTIGNIIRGDRWGHLNIKLNKNKKYNRRVRKNEIETTTRKG